LYIGCDRPTYQRLKFPSARDRGVAMLGEIPVTANSVDGRVTLRHPRHLINTRRLRLPINARENKAGVVLERITMTRLEPTNVQTVLTIVRQHDIEISSVTAVVTSVVCATIRKRVSKHT
jgi:hypothetical protein